jgi:glycosyltransferase involved in cell wall biosynthesis
MKILMVSDFYPPIIGGAFKHVQTLSRQLVKRHHEVVVATIGNKYLNACENDQGVKVIRLEGLFQRIPFLFKNVRERYPPPVQDFFISRKLERIVAEEKPDIIHAHGWLIYSVLDREKFRIPLVMTLHDYACVCPNKILLKENAICEKPLTIECVNCARSMYGLAKSTFAYGCLKLNKRKLKFVDKYIAVSTFVKDFHLRQLNLKEKDIAVIPNFLEQQKHEAESEENRAFPDDFILFVGALSTHKGVDVLIRAYERLGTKTKLVLIGRQSPNCSLRKTKNIMIIENAPFNKILEAYSKCRFVVVPSIWPDPCPTVAFEAMSYKKALIASNVGGLKDIIIEGKTGLLTPPNDIEKLAEAMHYLLENPLTAKEMGRRGYDYLMRDYTPDVVIPKIEKIYADLCSSKDSARAHFISHR